MNDRRELTQALRRARTGQVIVVPGSTRIDLTGLGALTIPGGVTLAGERGIGTCMGALLFTHQRDVAPLLRAGGPGVRVTGLRLRGPDRFRRTRLLRRLFNKGGHRDYYTVPASVGILSQHDDLEVDNCELWAWHRAAIAVQDAKGAHVHHNEIHHCQRMGLGYGVSLDAGEALVECNTFDWCRHAVAGTGRPGTAYEARNNIVGPHANAHIFDMHGGRDRKDGTAIAGDRMNIHHNTVHCREHEAVVIRGTPRGRVLIHHNVFALPAERAVRRTRDGKPFRFGPNRCRGVLVSRASAGVWP